MAYPPWWKLLIYTILDAFVIFHVTHADILCVCSTPHCRQLKIRTCQTSAFCYTQYHELTYPAITRGCIDDRTPILCENRRPEGVQGPWPVLYCCQDNMCNKNAVPTIPPWTLRNNTNIRAHYDRNIELTDEYEDAKEPEEEFENAKKYETTTEQPYSRIPQKKGLNEDNSGNILTLNINPILIAVPLAGACALVAIAVFAVFILRKRDYSPYNRHLQTRHIVKAPPDGMKGSKYSVTLSDRCSECSQSKLLSQV